MRALNFGLVVVFLSLPVLGSGCAHEDRVIVRERRASPCAGGVYVEGHKGRRGRWHEGYWRCPGVVVVEEVDE